MPFRALISKEFRALFVQTAFGALLIVAADVFMYTRIGKWGHEVTTMLLMIFIPVAVLWTFISGQMSLHSEWNRGTVHWLLSYPLSGWSKVAAKLLAALTNAVLFLALAGAGMTFILSDAIRTGMEPQLYEMLQTPGFWPLMGRNVVWAVVIGILALGSLFLLGHVSYAAGKSVHKAGWLVNGIVFFGLSFAGPYVLTKLGALIDRIPAAPVYIPERGTNGVAEMVAVSAPTPALLVIWLSSFLALFLLAGWLLGHRSEV